MITKSNTDAARFFVLQFSLAVVAVHPVEIRRSFSRVTSNTVHMYLHLWRCDIPLLSFLVQCSEAEEAHDGRRLQDVRCLYWAQNYRWKKVVQRRLTPKGTTNPHDEGSRSSSSFYIEFFSVWWRSLADRPSDCSPEDWLENSTHHVHVLHHAVHWQGPSQRELICQQGDPIGSTDLNAHLVWCCHGYAQPSQTPGKQHLGRSLRLFRCLPHRRNSEWCVLSRPFQCSWWMEQGQSNLIIWLEAYILQKVSAPKWLGVNVVLWGLATACTAGAHDYHSLLIARIFLGIFEAAVAPSLILISSQWYTKSEQAPRFSLWYCGLGCGQIVGGIVSYAFQQVKHEPMAGWRIMFIVLGLVTIMVGMGAFYIIPDTPVEATFLSDNEKLALLHHVSVNRTGIQNTNYKPSQLIELLLDPQIYLLTTLTILVSRDRLSLRISK